MQYETLTDLLNNEAAAYDYFYALSPEMQTQLQQRRDIRDLRQLKQAAADIQTNSRPAAFLMNSSEKQRPRHQPGALYVHL